MKKSDAHSLAGFSLHGKLYFPVGLDVCEYCSNMSKRKTLPESLWASLQFGSSLVFII